MDADVDILGEIATFKAVYYVQPNKVASDEKLDSFYFAKNE